MINEDKVKKEIFKLVKKLYMIKRVKNEFIPGKSKISYAGRIYDSDELISLIDSSLDFWLTSGRYAKEFENRFAKFHGLSYCLLTNSGSSANLLAISALTSPLLKKRQLKQGDEVITAACGFPTTLNPIIQNNLIPVFVDIELGTYNIQTDNLEKAISKRTKAIVLSHTLGNPADMDKILRIAHKYNLWIIEDNCDSLGSRYRKVLTGTFSDMSTCSFYPAHHITMGEGGAVLTNNPLLKRIILSFRDWGRDCWCETGIDNTCGKRFSQKFGNLPKGYDHKYVYSHIGYNLKITDLQAAIGVAQLKKLPAFIIERRENFKRIYEGLKSLQNYFILPEAAKHSEPSWFGFPILVKRTAHFNRLDIVSFLERNKIATRMLFGGNLTKQPAYADIKYRIVENLNNTDYVMNNLFWIGVYPGLKRAQLNFMISKIKEFVKEK